eukprot:TRINITY_DN35540_c0_g1_i1.p1 TRINITY_DN35540_c0_g1~~TRINITY_DN35540_c0_g1_i1.p1  ORF type:complete len:378 (-),score=14.41 TRINITY_DN35540_c0_g1_i1:141-1274(-)
MAARSAYASLRSQPHSPSMLLAILFACAGIIMIVRSDRRKTSTCERQPSGEGQELQPWYNGLQNEGSVLKQLKKQDSRYGYIWHHFVSTDMRREVQPPTLPGYNKTFLQKLFRVNMSCISPGGPYDTYQQAFAIRVYTNSNSFAHATASHKLYYGLNHDLRQLQDYSQRAQTVFEYDMGEGRKAAIEKGYRGILVSKEKNPSADRPTANCTVEKTIQGRKCFGHRWGGYLYWLLRGLQHFLKDMYVKDVTLYRAMLPYDELTFAPNNILTWHAFTSSSKQVGAALRFLLNKGVLFEIRNAEGVDISAWSAYRAEDEVLILPGASLEVLAVINNAKTIQGENIDKLDNVTVVVVQMTKAFDLQNLELPPPNSACKKKT